MEGTALADVLATIQHHLKHDDLVQLRAPSFKIFMSNEKQHSDQGAKRRKDERYSDGPRPKTTAQFVSADI
jgi:hypothetical protein